MLITYSADVITNSEVGMLIYNIAHYTALTALQLRFVSR